VKYLITGLTGSVVPSIVEEIFLKDKSAFFYFAVRQKHENSDVSARVKNAVELLELDQKQKQKLLRQSKVIEIDIKNKSLNITSEQYDELVMNLDNILHGAADVRFDQPFYKIKISNVDFALAILNLYHDLKKYRISKKKTKPSLFYISSVFAYGNRRGCIKEDFPRFDYGKPENTYVETKSIAKKIMLKEILSGEQVTIFEPSIIGGSSKTGKIKSYNMFYLFLYLGFINKLPFLPAKYNQLDIVPLDWVASVISGFMTQSESGDIFKKGVIRLVSGKHAITNLQMKYITYNYYKDNKTYPEYNVSNVRFLPDKVFFTMFNATKFILHVLYTCCGIRSFRRNYLGVKRIEPYLPFVCGYKVFENEKSNCLIKKYTNCDSPPLLQDSFDENGILKGGYFPVLLKNTIRTGFGGRLKNNE